ncbi:hypothetical protein J8M51_28290 [Streptomyces scabiei]|nr:hypothetical protein [Streptomyces griseiscabiei]
MSSYELYTTPAPTGTWNVPMAGAARLSSEYDGGLDRLLAPYQKGKDKQWDALKGQERIRSGSVPVVP